MLTSKDVKGLAVGAFLVLLTAAQWAAGFLYAPTDANQGEVYRIIFFHVPAAFAAFTSSAALLVFSLMGLAKRNESALIWAKATAEVGFLFTLLTLATGSIWGRPTWGTWWTWDARLTTTFLLALLYAGFLLLHASMGQGPGRIRVCSVLGILIFADVPIIYKSVTWWRTLHQPPSMMRDGGASMDPEILHTMLAGILITSLYALWLGYERGRNLLLQDELEAASLGQLSV